MPRERRACAVSTGRPVSQPGLAGVEDTQHAQPFTAVSQRWTAAVHGLQKCGALVSQRLGDIEQYGLAPPFY